MQNGSRLIEHYDQKYRRSNYTLVKPLPIVRRPRDRFEMAAIIASSGIGKYLEIGAGSVWNRSSENGAFSGCGSSRAMVCANTQPDPGVALKPP